MAQLTGQNIVLGDSDDASLNNFLDITNGYRLWAGGTSGTAQFVDFGLTNNATNNLTGFGATIFARNWLQEDTAGGQQQGSISFEDVIINVAPQDSETPNGTVDLDFNSVTFTTAGLTPLRRSAFGHFGSLGSPTHNFTNVSWHGNNDSDVAWLVWTATNIDSDSSFTNLSFWNGELNPNEAQGAAAALSTNAVYNGLTFGPLGDRYQQADNLRMFLRFDNVNSTNIPPNHRGCVTNLDYRGIQSLNDSDYVVAIGVENGSHVALVNPLQGVPAASNALVFSNLLNDSERVRLDTFVATKPDYGTGQTRITFSDSDIGVGVYIPDSDLWVVGGDYSDSEGDFITSTVFEDSDASHGIYFRHQAFSQRNTNPLGSDIASYTNASGSEPIRTLESKSYRAYSWRQTDFGRLVTITPPPVNATDSEVAVARANGFDRYTGVDWTTTTDISASNDVFTEDSDIETAETAIALLLNPTDANDSTTAQATTPITRAVHIPATAKAIQWVDLATLRNANNDIVNLPYTQDNSIAQFNVDFVIQDSDVSSRGSEWVFAAQSIDRDQRLSTIRNTGKIRVVGNPGLDNTSIKVSLQSDSEIRFSLEDNATLRNLSLSSPNIEGIDTSTTISNLALATESDYESPQIYITGDHGETSNDISMFLGSNLNVDNVLVSNPITLNLETPSTVIIQDAVQRSKIIAGTNATIIASPPYQPTRLVLSLSNVDEGSRVNIYKGFEYISDSDILYQFTVDGENDLVLTNRKPDADDDRTFQDSDFAQPEGYTQFVVGVSGRHRSTTFWPIQVQQNRSLTDSDSEEYRLILSGNTSQQQFTSRGIQTQNRSLTIRPTRADGSDWAQINEYNKSQNQPENFQYGQVVIEVNGCSFPNFASTLETVYLFSEMREEQEYLEAMRERVGNLTIGAGVQFAGGYRMGTVVNEDIIQFTSSGVDILNDSEVLLDDATDSDGTGTEISVQALQGLYVTGANFAALNNLNEQIDIPSKRKATPTFDQMVISIPRQLGSVESIQQLTTVDLDERLLKRSTMVNLGTLTPILDSDGSLAATPYFS